MKKLRPLGEITEEMEPNLYEMVHDHKLQKHEILKWLEGWVDCHYPDAIETYEDGTHPVSFYGPSDRLK